MSAVRIEDWELRIEEGLRERRLKRGGAKKI